MKIIFALSLCFLFLPTAEVLAAKAKKSMFGFHYSGLVYRSTAEETKPDAGDSEKNSNSGLSTTLDDSYGWISHGNWNFYLFPFTGEGSIGLSYMTTETLETGCYVSLSSLDGDDKAASHKAIALSPFATYYMTLGNLTLENSLSLDISQAQTKQEGATPDELIRVSENQVGASLLFSLVFPLSKNLFYSPSINFSFASGERKIGDASEKTKGSEFSITPVAVRTTFD